MGKFNNNWHEGEFGPADRSEYFEYKYVNQNNEQFDLDLIERMKDFEENYKKST